MEFYSKKYDIKLKEKHIKKLFNSNPEHIINCDS